MQEDKLAQEIAKSLKKYQEESFHPYEIGAWEVFDKKRKTGGIPWWKIFSAGVAASMVIGAAWWWFASLNGSQIELNQTLSELNQTESASSETNISNDSGTEIKGNNSIQEFSGNKENSIGDQLADKSQTKANGPSEDFGENNQNVNLGISERKGDLVFLADTKEDDFLRPQDKSSLDFALKIEKPGLNLLNPILSVAGPETDFPTYAFNNYPVIEPSKSESKLGWEVGLSPAFGGSNSSQNAEVTSNSLGFGMAMAMEVSDKIQIGTGLAFNSLNQQSQFASSPGNMFASSMAPSKDKITLSQAQLDLPVFVQYPLTRSRSVSLRAGFSNIYSFNQEVDLESTVNRQVVVSGNGINSSVVRQESVVQKTNLESSNQRFYPFATLNLGLNVRLFENQRVNYVLMPFYNFPMTDFSGFMENPGMVGASFKVHFLSGKSK
ncbi:hypothetical protein E4S40_08855 [Algoriphagus kandeliae]|uniref:Outer membrane protein beta-barrel domain-containing protein n=1 Tax=Algoriphagus kandeliae TaxID=2562278 RepID=A0A4Y9QNG5_9BACT|nr:hypothetical protein [Algoriphagus kandeliae]TFV94139.1 hypothetical protein E4S40_08855 [Algoriphagus kandeliae]